MKAYVLSSFLCSIGGICYCMNTMSRQRESGHRPGDGRHRSSVIGGTLLTGGVGNVIGTLFGVLINGTIASIVQFNGKLASSWPQRAHRRSAVLLHSPPEHLCQDQRAQ